MSCGGPQNECGIRGPMVILAARLLSLASFLAGWGLVWVQMMNHPRGELIEE